MHLLPGKDATMLDEYAENLIFETFRDPPVSFQGSLNVVCTAFTVSSFFKESLLGFSGVLRHCSYRHRMLSNQNGMISKK